MSWPCSIFCKQGLVSFLSLSLDGWWHDSGTGVLLSALQPALPFFFSLSGPLANRRSDRYKFLWLEALEARLYVSVHHLIEWGREVEVALADPLHCVGLPPPAVLLDVLHVHDFRSAARVAFLERVNPQEALGFRLTQEYPAELFATLAGMASTMHEFT